MCPANMSSRLSRRRAQLASFEHSYSLAIRLRNATGVQQFVVRTGNPMQPFRTTDTLAGNCEQVLALVA